MVPWSVFLDILKYIELVQYAPISNPSQSMCHCLSRPVQKDWKEYDAIDLVKLQPQASTF